MTSTAKHRELIPDTQLKKLTNTVNEPILYEKIYLVMFINAATALVIVF